MTTDRTEWHVAEPVLVGYASGHLPAVPSASVEAHLLGCRHCRDLLGRVAVDERDRAWLRLADAIDRPSPGMLERLTRGHLTTRSAIATPLLIRAAALAVALIGLVPLVAAVIVEEAALLAVLVLAPLAPVAAVTVAYRDWADPAGEITRATPVAGLRLVAMRALVVSVAAVVLTGSTLLILATFIDVPTRLAFAWCLPGLALAGLVLLAGTTRVDPFHVAVGLCTGWAATLVLGATSRRSLRDEVLLEVVAAPAFQAAALAVALATLLLTVVRREAVTYRRTA